MQYGRSFMFVFFFFSSRRRHTRYWRDWSSDVCSSDLRWAIGVFAVFFSAYDAAAGIGTGYALRNAQGLSAEGQAAVYEVVKDLPLISLPDRKSTRLNSSHANISYAVFCLKKQNSHSSIRQPHFYIHISPVSPQ